MAPFHLKKRAVCVCVCVCVNVCSIKSWWYIKQRLVNYGPLAKSGLLLVFKLYCNIHNDRKNYMEYSI